MRVQLEQEGVSDRAIGILQERPVWSCERTWNTGVHNRRLCGAEGMGVYRHKGCDHHIPLSRKVELVRNQDEPALIAATWRAFRYPLGIKWLTSADVASALILK